MQGKICLVTGANTGMGKVIATELARQGAIVVMVCRDLDKGQAAQREIQQITGNASVDLLIADLSSQADICRLAQEFHQHYSQLHVLINNAGGHYQKRELSSDGIEMNLAVNFLASFLLTTLLLDLLQATTPARIINVASNSMTRTINLNDLQSEHNFVPMQVYGQAKLALVLYTYALARRLKGTGVSVNALHPGLVGTDIVNKVAPPLFRPLIAIIKRFLLTPEQGAQTALFLATSSKLEGVTGKYFSREKEQPSVPISYDEALQEQLWKIATALTDQSNKKSAQEITPHSMPSSSSGKL